MIDLLTYMVATVSVIGIILLGYVVIQIYNSNDGFRSGE